MSTSGGVAAPAGAWTAADRGLVGVSEDPANVNNGGAVNGAGIVTESQVPVRGAGLCTGIMFQVTIAGVGLTAAQCFAGLWNPAGALIAQSADISVALAAAGLLTIPWTAPVAIPVGIYRTGFFWNGATAPQIAFGANNSYVNMSGIGQPNRFGFDGGGHTVALPNPLVLAGTNGQSWLFGLY